MGLVEMYAIQWLKRQINVSKAQEKLVMEFAKEIQKMMENQKDEKN